MIFDFFLTTIRTIDKEPYIKFSSFLGNSKFYEISQNRENLQVILQLKNHKNRNNNDLFSNNFKNLLLFKNVDKIVLAKYNFFLLVFEVQILTKISQNDEYLHIILLLKQKPLFSPTSGNYISYADKSSSFRIFSLSTLLQGCVLDEHNNIIIYIMPINKVFLGDVVDITYVLTVFLKIVNSVIKNQFHDNTADNMNTDISAINLKDRNI
ncbi:hypothetical protein AGLY_005212 [Aphis glycines]|uniref:Uncharacterized protein n=1 Tax=Aphis glycines TaxID=307491 RepID=A0A6G0TWK3_APHGL|nr:hypothetical protein AGLY_005212 [Aphis glycines]